MIQLSIQTLSTGKRCWKSGQDRDGFILETRWSSRSIGSCRQNTSIANLVNRIDSIAAAALRNIQRIVENCQAAKIIILPGLVWRRGRRIADLSDFEISKHIDHRRQRRRRVRNKEFGTGGSDKIQANLSSSQLGGVQASIVVIARQIIKPICL